MELSSRAQYSSLMGMTYVFNLIVGTGALAIPKAFASAGWAISICMITVISFLSCMTSTFVIESMSCANAILKIETLKKNEDSVDISGMSRNVKHEESNELQDERLALIQEQDIFDIREIVELGTMAKMFFNKVGYYLFYSCIVIYLYGDLSIYAVAVPKSLRDVTCTYYHNSTINYTTTTTIATTSLSMTPQYFNIISSNTSDFCFPPKPSDPCWPSSHLTRIQVYRIYVILFVVFLGSFVFFNLQKTKYLQIVTSLLRWIAFFTMVTITVKRLAAKEGTGQPPVALPSNIPNFFGVCVYAFMCHHSLPQLITPISSKRNIYSFLGFTTLFVLFFYCLLSLTGIFCFKEIYDLYTLNFQPSKCPTATNADVITTSIYIQYFLALFPVFTISTSFPIIGITLLNNLKNIFGFQLDSRKSFFQTFIDRILLPLLVLVCPLSIALLTSDIQFLVGITGSYAGTFIQYIVPASLVLLARRRMTNLHFNTNAFKSPFSHPFWIYLIFIWSVVCLVVVTVNNVLKI